MKPLHCINQNNLTSGNQRLRAQSIQPVFSDLLGLKDLDGGFLVEVNGLEDLHHISKIFAKLQVVEQLNCQLVLLNTIDIASFGLGSLLKRLHHGLANTLADFNLEGQRLAERVAMRAAESHLDFMNVVRGEGMTVNLDGDLQFDGLVSLERPVHGQVDGFARQALQLSLLSHTEENTVLPGPLSTVANFYGNHEHLSREDLKLVARHSNDLGTLELPWLLTTLAATVAFLVCPALTALEILLELIELLHTLFNLG